MIQLALLLLLFLLPFHVKAQQHQMNQSSSSVDGGIGNFQPSLAVVIGILSLMFSLTFILLLYAKFCQRRASAHVDPENPPALMRSRSRCSGIDKTVIESLPFFRFSSLRGLKEGLECAVCLSKFEDVEILRLLPKCKHAFHIDCIDHWLEKHSSCPLCRRKVTSDDPTMITYSNSLRLLTMNQPEINGEEPNIEIFVQREEDQSHGSSSSSRFRIGSSFRKSGKGIVIKEEELPIKEEETEHEDDDDGKLYHKHNHKINISDVVFKHRWSNVSSSDLMFLNSEMIISSVESKRFNLSEPNGEKIRASTSAENGEIFNIKEEMERKKSLETKVGALNSVLDTSDCVETSTSSGHTSKYVNPGDKRSMSEITGMSRFRDLGMRDRVLKDSSMVSSNDKEERRSQLWLPIARRTAQWFVNRERSRPLNV